MTPFSTSLAAVVPSIARTLGLLILLLPVALAAGRLVGGRRDRATAILAGACAAVCTLVIGGLVLSSFAGVGLAGWLAMLAVVDLAVAVVAIRRHWLDLRFLRELAPRAPRPLTVSILAAALALVTGSVLMSVASARRQERRVHFTQLWMLPAARGTAVDAEIGVRNLEGRTVSYRIRVTAGRTTLFSAPVRLASTGSWATTVRLAPATPRELVTTTLYRGSTPYRVTNLWTPGG